MGTHRPECSAGAALALGLLLAMTGCTRIVLDPGLQGESCVEDEDCTTGLLCIAGVCLEPTGTDSDANVSTDAAAPVPDTQTPDATPVDTFTSPDTTQDIVTEPDTDAAILADIPGDTGPDTAEDADTSPDTAEDADTGQGAPQDTGEDTAVDTAVDTAPLADVAPDTGPDPDAAQDIVEDVEDVEEEGPPALGAPCDGVCQPGLVCLPQGDGTSVCSAFAEGVCLPCVEASDCPTAGAECLDAEDGEGYCGAACAGDSDCPYGFDCDGGQCTPWTKTCACTAGLLGQTLGCENQGPNGLCTGVMICQLNGWSTCSANPPTDEICDGVDNDCDGFIDELPYYIENGLQLPFGSLCGVGQCAGGEVVCAPDGTATCSTNGLATPEACADNEDNNCDGVVNEDCESQDWDGDGVPNDLDCHPFDSQIYQGAPEPCCPAEASLEVCDLNCDGAALSCASCDADGDGSCPPADCDDSDPNVYPGAPEKCDDQIDQDCQGGDLVCDPAKDLDHDDWIPPHDCNEGNPAVHPLAPELCDNLDNDCDGVTDEGNPQAGQPCGTGDAYCQQGVMVCTHYLVGAAIHCQGAILFEPEKCDGIDNDCNGAIDEAFPSLGMPCDGPDTDLCANGTTVCLGNGSGIVCADETVTNLYETCNGIDDDCNGATDEFVCPLYDLDADGLTVEEGDCDDLDAGRYPGADEPCCDQALSPEEAAFCDLNCDGIVIPCALTDVDADGFTPGQGDCDDTDPHTYPGAIEKCGDGIDQDCLAGDLSCATVSDVDGDGFHSGIDCNDTNHTVNPWAKEDCNYIDEDCDGLIDEGNPTGQIGTCGPDVPECNPGTWVCVHDDATSTVQVLCITDKFQSEELCNDLDDDCDGEVDEVFFDLGLPCDGPDSDQCQHGVLVCQDDGNGLTCGPESPSDIPEICDTVDNDCDGNTDEGAHYNGIGLGQVCEGTGTCGPGIVQCNAIGATTCSTHADGAFSQAVPESCNTADDDCDGNTDEGFTYQDSGIGGPCEGVGACGAGVVECWGLDDTTCSTHPGASQDESSPEICDGSDNNCDGHVDEGVDVASSPCGQSGVCALGEGTAECKAGEWVCQFEGVPGWEADETLCDGLDNDCDGAVDEGWFVGEPCDGPDSDLCENGTWACGDSGDEVVCDNETSLDVFETCNDLDDDCDGITDELDVEPDVAGCLDTGVCTQDAAILVVCAGTGVGCDYSGVPDYQVIEGLCDGQDNDCDGLTDEALFMFGQPLGGPCEGKGACSQGAVQCHPSDGSLICSSEPGGATDESQPESCNGLDDDCDGQTDEDFAWNGLAVGSECPPTGICTSGLVECLGDGTTGCSTGVGGSDDQTQSESCNALDDDCDGQTDEISDLDLNEAGCLATGSCTDIATVITCEEGTWHCNYELLDAWQQFENLCDELDNDCDGETDEHLPLKGTPCDGPDADACATGTWSCSPDAAWLVCTNETGEVSVEVCDGEDNDCDGIPDNGMVYDSKPLAQLCDGVGACGTGVVECNTQLEATCSTNPDGTASEAAIEICEDSSDNDCDGLTDEVDCQPGG